MSGNATPVTASIPVAGQGPSAEHCNASFEESRVVLVLVYSVVCALGLPANCLTAWLTLLQVLQGNVLAVYLLCLALCELLYLGTLPLWILYIQNGHRWTLGLRACRATAYIFFCNIYLSILFLCCVSCERFVAVVYALESRGRRHQRTAMLVSAAIFVLVGLVHYPVFQMEEEEAGACFEPLRMSATIAAFHYARFSMGFAVPLAIIAYTNHRILRSVGRSPGLTAAQKAKVRRSAAAVTLIFLFCFAPYHLVLLLKAAAFSYYHGDRDAVCAFEASFYSISVGFLCLATVNSVADPIIYVLATEHSRHEVSRIHSGWRKWSAKVDAVRLTSSRDSEDIRLPATPAKDCPRPQSPPGPELGMAGAST